MLVVGFLSENKIDTLQVAGSLCSADQNFFTLRPELRCHCKFCRPESRAGFACILACQSFVSGTRMYFIGFEFIFLFFSIFNGLLRLLDGKDPEIVLNTSVIIVSFPMLEALDSFLRP